MAEGASLGTPEPEDDDLGRYLEDTITIDWQTPALMECARELLDGAETAEQRLRRPFEFVRDEIRHALDAEPEASVPVACRASEVLRAGAGLCYAKSHLLAALLRFAGFPTGFCYARMASSEEPGRFVLHGFNAVHWAGDGAESGSGSRDDAGATAGWILLDAGGRRGAPRAELRMAPPWSLSVEPDPERGEGHLPTLYRRPGKRVIDLLERAPDLAAVCRNLPDAL